MKIDFSKLNDSQLANLVDNRWNSSDEIWSVIKRVYDTNTRVYSNESDWLNQVPSTIKKTQANRITPNMEATINSVIANPPGLNFIPGREGEESQELAGKLERFFLKKLQDRNVKEDMRMGLRNLYFGRLIVLKPFWNAKINDFDCRAINPKDVRFGKYSKNEEESEFAIETIKDNLCSVIAKFPEKEEELLSKSGFTMENKEQAYIKNPEIEYKEAWIGDYVIWKYDNIILNKMRNPYWDWDGILMTDEEEELVNESYDDSRRMTFQQIKLQQDNRTIEGTDEYGEPISYNAYYFNYFDGPRKPYIFATILNDENKPIGRTDFITLARPLQESIDRRKQDIGYNCELVNGVIKVDSEVMSKDDAQGLAYQAKGIIWGNGVVDGVQREMGQPLPAMVFDDMIDSRQEIDNIMAASSAFRGEREGQETKAGRLALIQQSYLRLNELVQVVDYVYGELFKWFYQLAKTRYTEYHYAKWVGKEEAYEIMGLIQDDFENGSDITIMPGKTLPVDTEFRFERAQADVERGIISPMDYFKEAGYMDTTDLAKNAVMYQLNPAMAVGITPEEMQQIAPPQQPEEKEPSKSINYKDLTPDAQVQLLAQAGIQANPEIVVAEAMAQKRDKQTELEMRRKTPQGEVEVKQEIQ